MNFRDLVGGRSLLYRLNKVLHLWAGKGSLYSGCYLLVGVLHKTLDPPGSISPAVSPEWADHLSRSFSTHHKWSFCPDIAKVIFQQWGTLLVDLFMISQNRKCHQFCSLFSQSPGSLTDAFLFSYTKHLFYAIPPSSTHAQSSSEGQVGQSEGYSYSPILGMSALGTHTARPVSCNSGTTPFSPRPDLSGPWSNAPLKLQPSPPDSMGFIGLKRSQGLRVSKPSLTRWIKLGVKTHKPSNIRILKESTYILQDPLQHHGLKEHVLSLQRFAEQSHICKLTHLSDSIR